MNLVNVTTLVVGDTFKLYSTNEEFEVIAKTKEFIRCRSLAGERILKLGLNTFTLVNKL